ncbi:MAG: phosphatase PAP2 family protein [Prevotella sp.]|nr:phosphatase PAP2 family protein [Prevotella sp.]MDY6130742.1 phosphatase PAP2 family protein [Prevotella sp.]
MTAKRERYMHNVFTMKSMWIKWQVLLLLGLLGVSTKANAEPYNIQDLPEPPSIWESTETLRDSLSASFCGDSLHLLYRFKKRKHTDNLSYMGLAFVASGLLVKSEKKDFREMRHYFQPKFKVTWDNYTQYVPLALTWTLKACKVEGRSSWARLATSNVLSFSTMALLVNSLKYSTHELRPDGTSYNSFPSGHTATSFVCASILHREYGLTRSPWYSVAGYSIATATGICRILNNRHWISDVLVGAGVGILSTDIGYFLGDLIFKGKGISRGRLSTTAPDISDRTSFLSLGIQTGIGPNYLDCPDIYDNYNEHRQPFAPDDPRGVSHPLGLKLYFGTSTSLNVEGAYFLNNYVGIGGCIRATSLPIVAGVDLNNGFLYNVKSHSIENKEDSRFFKFVGVESNHISTFDFNSGLYFSYPFGKRVRLGTKFLFGRRFSSDYEVDAIVDVDVEGIRNIILPLDPSDPNLFNDPSDKQALLEALSKMGDGKGMHDHKFMSIKPSRSFVYSTGLSLTWAYKEGMAFKLNLDYDYSHPKYTYEMRNRWYEDANGEVKDIVDTFTRRTHINVLSLGLGMSLFF